MSNREGFCEGCFGCETPCHIAKSKVDQLEELSKLCQEQVKEIIYLNSKLQKIIKEIKNNE